MINITTKELEIDNELKNKIEFICDFCYIKLAIMYGSIRKIGKTTYIEPHKIIVKDTTFLAFNYSTYIYVDSLNNFFS